MVTRTRYAGHRLLSGKLSSRSTSFAASPFASNQQHADNDDDSDPKQFLQQMMRHSTIQTTMKYYVGRDAHETSKVIYAAFAQSQNVNTSVNSADSEEAAIERK